MSHETCRQVLIAEVERVEQEIRDLGPAPAWGSVDFYAERQSVRHRRFELSEELAGLKILMDLYTAGLEVSAEALCERVTRAGTALTLASREQGAWTSAFDKFKTLSQAGRLPASVPDVAAGLERAAAELGVSLETDA